mmetsp:Transcript_3966/g.5328  ORF Transcript_3966/g.5328 Transcript_3966/m.5328 type:complete len:444 (+) Transcript_3966:47-1378(+)|eukprot:jgi/Bigna1/86489/estExt_fgenesh1_pg.C_110015
MNIVTMMITATILVSVAAAQNAVATRTGGNVFHARRGDFNLNKQQHSSKLQTRRTRTPLSSVVPKSTLLSNKYLDGVGARSSPMKNRAALMSNPFKAITKSKEKTQAIQAKNQRYTSSDWFKNLRSLILMKSDILKRISGHLTFNIALAVVGAALFTQMPQYFPAIPAIGHTLSGVALSLLLVFRTNSAYDRFWEARKILGAVVDNSRGLSRVAPTALPPHLAHEFGRMIITFPYMLRLHLTGRGQIPIKDTTDGPDVLPFINQQHLKTVESYFSKPMATLSIMNQILHSKEAMYPDEDPHKTLTMMPQRQILQNNVNTLVANTGACERILGCPVPLSYSRHLSRYLTIWSATLPLVLAPMLGWTSVPVIAAVCWSLFSIEEIGHMIEEPFEALPYDQVQTKRVADVIKRDTLAMFNQQLGVDLAKEPDWNAPVQQPATATFA